MTFTFDYYEDKEDIKLIMSMNHIMSAIFDFEQELRSRYKYLEKQETTWEEVRELWFEKTDEIRDLIW